MAFAVNKHLLYWRLPANIAAITAGILILHKATNYGLVKDKETEYRRIFASYENEVKDQKFRGLKLFGGRHISKLEEREFTTSHLDDFKRLITT